MFNSRRRAITLVDLTVVCLVWLVIAATLFPVFARARENARRSSCQSNLRAIARATRHYVDDNAGRYPPLPTNNARGWAGVLPARLVEGFECPSGYAASSKSASDYVFNARLAQVSSTRVSRPALVLAWGDGLDNGAQGTFLDASGLVSRHLDGANCGFVDGHVKWFRAARLNDAANQGRKFRFEIK